MQTDPLWQNPAMKRPTLTCTYCGEASSPERLCPTCRTMIRMIAERDPARSYRWTTAEDRLIRAGVLSDGQLEKILKRKITSVRARRHYLKMGGGYNAAFGDPPVGEG